MKKELILSEKLKNRKLPYWNSVSSVILKFLPELDKFDNLVKARDKYTNKLVEVLYNYTLDEETVRLFKKNPGVFKTTNTIKVLEDDLGIDLSMYKRPVRKVVALNVTNQCIPSCGGGFYKMDEAAFKKCPEVDLDILRDAASEMYKVADELLVDFYDEEGNSLFSKVDTYGQLYKFNKDLYRCAVVWRFGENWLKYKEEPDTTAPPATKSELLKLAKQTNDQRNKELLEELKKIINI